MSTRKNYSVKMVVVSMETWPGKDSARNAGERFRRNKEKPRYKVMKNLPESEFILYNLLDLHGLFFISLEGGVVDWQSIED